MAYKKCPRCNLNYIKETDLLCKICLEEVGKAYREMMMKKTTIFVLNVVKI